MNPIVEFDVVRVIALEGTAESHLAISDAARPPAVGEVGTVVALTPTYDPSDLSTRYIVELNANDGSFVWLAEFARQELELVSRPNPLRADPVLIDQLRNQWLSAAPAHDMHREYVERYRVLPLTSDMGGFYGITSSGQLLEFAWEGEETGKPLIDLRLMNVALFQGAEKYPSLRELLPKRPRNAATCEICNGLGKIAELSLDLQEKVICYCGGAGWLPAGTPQMRREAKMRAKRWWQIWLK